MHAWHRELTRKGQNCREQGRRNKRTPAPRHGATLLLRSAVLLYEASVARSQPLLPWKYHTHVRPAQCFARETHPPQNPQLSDFGSVLRNATCAGRIKHHHQQLGHASWQLPCNLRNPLPEERRTSSRCFCFCSAECISGPAAVSKVLCALDSGPHRHSLCHNGGQPTWANFSRCHHCIITLHEGDPLRPAREATKLVAGLLEAWDAGLRASIG